jgi:hypothetical protein
MSYKTIILASSVRIPCQVRDSREDGELRVQSSKLIFSMRAT